MLIDGTVHPAFAEVARSLRRILPKNGKGGAAVCVYHEGRKVVDVWGGTRDDKGAPWEHDTLSVSFSTTKGIASTLLHVFIDRGLVDLDAPVARYWPEFAQAGKESVTVRQLLCHEAGLYAIADIIEHAHELLRMVGRFNRFWPTRSSNRLVSTVPFVVCLRASRAVARA
jgi:CubicO group peptidase (beta-lactamase class C family)